MHSQRMFKYLVAFTTLALTVACADGGEQDALQRSLDAIAEAGATRVHALITTEGSSPLELTSGIETEDGSPVLESYEIGFSTAPFVATVILQLAEEGALSLDDAAAVPGGGPTTIRELLRAAPAADGSASMDSAPVQQAIERATGQTWEQEIEDRILAPLGLDGTVVGRESRVDVTPHGTSPTGMTTPEEARRFFEALLGGELLAPDRLAEMLDGTPDPASGDERYGLGVVWRPLSCGGGYWGQTSTTRGYRSYVA